VTDLVNGTTMNSNGAYDCFHDPPVVEPYSDISGPGVRRAWDTASCAALSL